MVTQSGDPNNKSRPAYRKYCSYCHESNHSISNCYQKQRDDEYQKIKIKDKELPNNHLYNTSVVNPVIRKKMRMKIKMSTLPEIMTATNMTRTITPITRIDIVVNAETTHKIIIDLILDKDITIDLQVHTHLDPDMTIIIKEELHLDLHIDHLTETIPMIYTIPDQDIDLVLNHKGNSSKRYNYPYRSPSRPRDYKSRSRTPTQNRQQSRINQKDVQPTNDKDSTKFEIHTCQNTEFANTITPYSWFYPLYVHASGEKDNLLPSKL